MRKGQGKWDHKGNIESQIASLQGREESPPKG